jgi:hypothetical protein
VKLDSAIQEASLLRRFGLFVVLHGGGSICFFRRESLRRRRNAGEEQTGE